MSSVIAKMRAPTDRKRERQSERPAVDQVLMRQLALALLPQLYLAVLPQVNQVGAAVI